MCTHATFFFPLYEVITQLPLTLLVTVAHRSHCLDMKEYIFLCGLISTSEVARCVYIHRRGLFFGMKCFSPLDVYNRLFTICLGTVTNYREGGYKMGGGACEVLPIQKGGGGRNSFIHAEGGAQQVLG